MMGDFNIDNSQMHCHTNQLHMSLKHFMSMFGMSQLINTSTRITSTTSTIVDLILISDPAKISQCGVLDLGLSDHQVIHCIRKCKKIPTSRHNGVTLRSLRNYSKYIFEEKLHEVDCQDVLDSTSVHEAIYHFNSKLMVVIKQRTAPWMSGEILHLIFERDRAFSKFRKTKDASWHRKFISLRNQVQYKKKHAKSDFIANETDEFKQQPKQLRQLLKSLGTSAHCNSKPGSIGLNIDNNICFDK